MPRWYLQGEASDPGPDLQHDLAAMVVGWEVVPNTGHPMGLQNPEGLATNGSGETCLTNAADY
jgi:hypothetical protein